MMGLEVFVPNRTGLSFHVSQVSITFSVDPCFCCCWYKKEGKSFTVAGDFFLTSVRDAVRHKTQLLLSSSFVKDWQGGSSKGYHRREKLC